MFHRILQPTEKCDTGGRSCTVAEWLGQSGYLFASVVAWWWWWLFLDTNANSAFYTVAYDRKCSKVNHRNTDSSLLWGKKQRWWAALSIVWVCKMLIKSNQIKCIYLAHLAAKYGGILCFIYVFVKMPTTFYACSVKVIVRAQFIRATIWGASNSGMLQKILHSAPCGHTFQWVAEFWVTPAYHQISCVFLKRQRPYNTAIACQDSHNMVYNLCSPPQYAISHKLP